MVPPMVVWINKSPHTCPGSARASQFFSQLCGMCSEYTGAAAVSLSLRAEYQGWQRMYLAFPGLAYWRKADYIDTKVVWDIFNYGKATGDR